MALDVVLGNISAEDAEFWKAYPLVLTTRRTSYGDVAPYFVEWLRTAFLEPRYGRDLYDKGLRIYTTLDLDMQEAAEQALQSQLDEIESGVFSNGKFEGTSYREYLEQGRATGDEVGPFSQYLQGALFVAVLAFSHTRGGSGQRAITSPNTRVAFTRDSMISFRFRSW